MNDTRNAIQTERTINGILVALPTTAPELSGLRRLVRRPHREMLLQVLGALSLLLGLASATPLPIGPIAALICLAVLGIARRDLAEMKSGTTDPGGEMAAIEAWAAGWFGLVSTLLNTAAWWFYLLRYVL